MSDIHSQMFQLNISLMDGAVLSPSQDALYKQHLAAMRNLPG